MRSHEMKIKLDIAVTKPITQNTSQILLSMMQFGFTL